MQFSSIQGSMHQSHQFTLGPCGAVKLSLVLLFISGKFPGSDPRDESCGISHFSAILQILCLLDCASSANYERILQSLSNQLTSSFSELKAETA